MKTFFVGIDISKDWLDVCILDASQMQQIDAFRVDNTITGIEDLIGRCGQATPQTELWCCFEHTGHYGLLLAELLELHAIVYSAVAALEIKQSIGMIRGKDDRTDAARIAHYAAVNHFKLKATKLPQQELLTIKSMLTYRAQLIGISRQLQNSRKSHALAARTSKQKELLEDMDKRIEDIKEDIKSLEKQIQDLIKQHQALAKTFNKIITVKGVGLLIAATMIVCTENFKAFDNPRKFNCYAGLAPFAHSSGSSIHGKTKTSNLRNKTIKTLLFNGANVAANFDYDMKSYYKRKKTQGKHHMSIINAVACKMVYRMFAVVKREEPYVNFMR